MNTNTNENNELTPLITQPAATTRRGFIKRTASAAIVTTFAFNAFADPVPTTPGDQSLVDRWTYIITKFGAPMEAIAPPTMPGPNKMLPLTFMAPADPQNPNPDPTTWVKTPSWKILFDSNTTVPCVFSDGVTNVMDMMPTPALMTIPLTVKARSRVLGDYQEVLSPDPNAEESDYDYYGTFHQFDWEIEYEISSAPGLNTTGLTQPIKGKLYHTGQVWIDAEDGTQTGSPSQAETSTVAVGLMGGIWLTPPSLTPPPPPGAPVTANPNARPYHIQYEIKIIKTATNFFFIIRLWPAIQNTFVPGTNFPFFIPDDWIPVPPPAAASPSGPYFGDDEFDVEPFTYKIPDPNGNH